ncbi:MAG: glycosyltransferase family 39 protein [Candidatus Portnoybacteria bacterium]
MDNKTTNIVAIILLSFTFLLGFFSMRGDSTTMDELAHIPAGYSYIVKHDMRLNPEHPPLLKDLSGLSIWLGSKITQTTINFPEEHKSWQEDLNGQWDFGREFLYRSGNDADQIVFWARLPMLLILLLFGFYVFKWAREIYGNSAGLIALFLYSLSPTFLAHGRYVTTDVGAAAAFFIAIYYLVKWLKETNIKNLIFAGLAFGLALLTKFSLILLIPFFIFLVFVWAVLKKPLFPNLLKYLGGLFLIGLIGLILIWPVYQCHVSNYPVERQYQDTVDNLSTYGNRLFADPVVWMSGEPSLRAYGQFFLGILMVVQRSVGGNTTYFLGEVSNLGWKEYFPIVFAIKVPLALFALILISLFYSSHQVKEPFYKKTLKRFFNWIRNHPDELALFSFFAVYWYATLRTNLNIGVRHILPTFPALYVLISGQIGKIIKKHQTWRLIILLLFIWYGFSAVSVYPHFLTYFNESIGGPSQGHKYVVDSNLDWGQDLKRLTQYVEEHKIETIYLDYFGGDSPEYRLGEKFQPWWGDRNPNDLNSGDWLAVSASLLQGGKGCPTPSLGGTFGYYRWLNEYEPAATIGNSIFVYNIK